MEGSAISSDAKMGEESSWTFYIQGFICDNNDDDKNTSLISSEFESPSLVSDAASSAVKKLANNCNCTEEGVGFSSGKSNTPTTIMSKQNSFKKQKTKVIPSMDYDLEDTASSPVNSPKQGSYMNQFMNQKEKPKMDVSEVKRNSFGKGGVFAVERDSYYAELKKRSTCG